MRIKSKLLLAVLAVVLSLGQGLTALAADSAPVQKVNAITVWNSSGKRFLPLT